jgi:hypothetical protein
MDQLQGTLCFCKPTPEPKGEQPPGATEHKGEQRPVEAALQPMAPTFREQMLRVMGFSDADVILEPVVGILSRQSKRFESAAVEGAGIS